MNKLCLLLIGLALLASCTHPEELPPTPLAPGQTTPVATGQLATVSIENFAFNPAIVTINAGDQIRFTNKDSAPHTATGPNFDTGPLKEGESKVITFDTPGEYPYLCSFHGNMKGEIIVK